MNDSRILAHVGAILIAGSLSAFASAMNGLPRATPESVHVDSAQLLQYVETLDSQIDGMNSLMIVRAGKVIAEGWWTPYDANSRHTMYSLSKSFTSTAIGIAQAEGKLSIDDTIVSFFPD